jgi:hypothetical protein
VKLRTHLFSQQRVCGAINAAVALLVEVMVFVARAWQPIRTRSTDANVRDRARRGGEHSRRWALDVPGRLEQAGVVMALRTASILLVHLVLLGGCGDRIYRIRGKVVVARRAPDGAAVPTVLCVGKGGPLESSGLYGHPANRTEYGSVGTIFCGHAPQDIDFPLDEIIIGTSMPRRAHVYAWLEPVPAAEKLCAGRGTAMLQVDRQTLDRLMSPEHADNPRDQRAPVTWPCGRNPTPGMPMAYSVTFDPDHPTWSEDWVEKRTLRIE